MGSKGNRRENQAVSVYEDAGYDVQVFYGKRYGDQDAFGLFDFIATHPNRKPRFGQVKSNRARGINKWAAEAAATMNADHVEVDFLVCYDAAGWRLVQPVGDGYETVYDEREDDSNPNMGEGLTDHLTNDD